MRQRAGVTIHRHQTDLGAVLRHAVDERDGVRTARDIAVEVSGDLHGQWGWRDAP